MAVHTQESVEKCVVKFWAPWSGSLWLVKTAPGFWNRKICLQRGYHELQDVSNAVGNCSSMTCYTLWCEGCQAYIDEAFIKTSGDVGDPLLGKCLDGLDYRRKRG